MRFRSLFLILAGAALTIAATLTINLAAPQLAKAAVAGTYQYPCFPYGTPNFYFGQYISGWGYHVGDDVCHEAGTPVYAVANGTVMYSARTPDSYRWGNLIMIEHTNDDGNKVVSIYGHLNDDRRVAAGQEVIKGQQLGVVGQQGASNGNWEPHTHFGIHNGGYGSPVGSYAPYIHGYEPSCCAGWLAPGDYVRQRLVPYDQTPYDVIGGGDIYNNSEIQVTFRVRNTGAYTWFKDGSSSTPTRLGTVIPRDRLSGFSGGGTAPGWAGYTRIKLDNNTGPGGLATFTATFKSNQSVGTYNECFSPVVETVGWLPEHPICVTVRILPPGWRGQYYTHMITTNSDPTNLTGQTNADYLLPGDKRNLKLLVKNVGELDWGVNSGDLVRLATSRPNDRPSSFATGGDSSIPLSENWPWYNRPSNIDGRYDPGTNSVVADSVITTGEIAVFSFTITAPDQPGSYQEFFNPVVEGRTQMPDLGMWFGLRVLDRGYHYEFVRYTENPTTIGSGVNSQDVTLQIKNSGRVSWPVGASDFRLGTDNPRGYDSSLYTASGTGAWISPSRLASINRNVTTPGKTTIDPSEVGEFSARLTIPPTFPAGTARLYLRPLVENVTWLPENYGLFLPITVTAQPYNYQFMRVTYSGDTTNFVRGTTMTAKLAVKNTGRVTWPVSGSGAIRLATERPKARLSGFADFTAPDPWINQARASEIDGRVTDINTLATTPATQINPGEIALFSVPLKANPDPGTYNEYFNLVSEFVSWFPDYGMFFPLTVR